MNSCDLGVRTSESVCFGAPVLKVLSPDRMEGGREKERGRKGREGRKRREWREGEREGGYRGVDRHWQRRGRRLAR